MTDAPPDHSPNVEKARAHPSCWLPLLLGLAGLGLLAILGNASLPRIEARAEGVANAALSGPHPWANVKIDNGVAYLVGDAPDPAARADAFKLVQGELADARGFPGVFQSFVDGAPAAPNPIAAAAKEDAKQAETKTEDVKETAKSEPAPAPKAVASAPAPAPKKTAVAEPPLAVPDAVAPPAESWKKAEASKKAKDSGNAGRLDLAACRASIRRIGANVPFSTNSGALGPRGRARVAQLADIIARCESVQVTIEGHTDRRGSTSANQRLSERRAQAVLAALVAEGAPEPVLVSRGFGETRPLRTERTARAEAVNRRVVLVVRAN